MAVKVPHNWAPREYQMPLWEYLDQGGKRASIVWHRRAGKDLTGINWCIYDMVRTREPGVYWHLLPTYTQGRKIVWDGFTNDGSKFTDFFPNELLAGKPNKQEMKIQIIDTRTGAKDSGSIYQVVGTDDIDRLVGPNPKGCIFSEYALQDPRVWRYISPILAANGGWALFITTFRGKNHAYRQHTTVHDHPDWFSQTLTVDDTYYRKDGKMVPVITPEMVEAERQAGMPEELIQQEYYCVPDAGTVGSIYGDLMSRLYDQKRINNEVTWDPDKPVYTAWDIGVADATCVWFYQIKGDEIHFIDYYEYSAVTRDERKGLLDHIKEINKRPYSYAKHFAPHDIKQPDKSSGIELVQVAKNHGCTFKVLPKTRRAEGIDAVRRLLPKARFNKAKCAQGIDALTEYHRKFDEKKQIFTKEPIHDWSSHGADAMRYAAMGMPRIGGGGGVNRHGIIIQQKAISDYDRFA